MTWLTTMKKLILLLPSLRTVVAFLPTTQQTAAFRRPDSFPSPTGMCSVPRRQVLSTSAAVIGASQPFGGILATLLVTSPRSAVAALSAAASPTTTDDHVLIDAPMIRLKLPQAGLGREYVAVQLSIDGKGPFDFMVDTGLTTELITPHLVQSLGIAQGSQPSATIQGFAAGGQTVAHQLVELQNAALCGGRASSTSCSDALKLPVLHAVITDFPQEHIDPLHDPVEGMIGMELISLFDVDFDFPNNRIRFCKPGTAAREANAKAKRPQDKLVEIPAVVINETQLIGIRVTIQGAKQPILGFLDCGSTFSCVNWASAPYLNIPPPSDKSYQSMNKYIQAIGVDGRLLKLPLVRKQVTFAGNAKVDRSTGRPTAFEPAPPEFEPWQPVDLGVGDIPAFASILGDGIHPYQGPAALIGLDILSQRRVIFEAGSAKSRERKVHVGVA